MALSVTILSECRLGTDGNPRSHLTNGLLVQSQLLPVQEGAESQSKRTRIERYMVKNLPKWNETLTKISLDKFEAKLSEAKKSVSMRAQINK